MTRLVTCGYETGDVNENGASTINTNATLTAVATTPTPRGGAYCLKAAPTSSTTNLAYKTFALGAAKTDVWMRWAVYINAGNIGSSSIVLAAMYDSGAAAQTCLNWDGSTQSIVARQGIGTAGTVLATSGTQLTAGAWHVLEWRTQITSATAGTTEVWQDGTRVINFSGDNTAAGTAANVQTVGLGIFTSVGVTTPTWYIAFDDIAINDTAGTVNNGRPGDGRVVLLSPTGAGSNTALTRGGTDTGANWSQESELPPSMAQYVFSSTAATRDTYALGDMPVAASSINCCEVIALAQNSDAGGGSVGLTVKSGVTTNEGTAIALGTSAGYIRQLYETDPNTSAAWTGTAVNALEAGATVR